MSSPRRRSRTSRSSPTTLINGSPNVDYYTTFDNYTVGVQQATSLLTTWVLSTRAEEIATQAYFQRGVLRRRPKKQRQRHLERRHGHARGVPRRPARVRTAAILPRLPWPRSAWRTCSPPPTPAASALTASCPPTTACPSASCRAEGLGLRLGRPAVPGRHRPGRGARLGQVDPRRRAELDLQGHP